MSRASKISSQWVLFGFCLLVAFGVIIASVFSGARGAKNPNAGPQPLASASPTSSGLSTETDPGMLAVNDALSRYKAARTVAGGSQSTVVAPDGNVLATSTTPGGDFSIASQDVAVPEVIFFQGKTYRKTPGPKGTWVVNDKTVAEKTSAWVFGADPASLLDRVLPYSTVADVQRTNDGMQQVTLEIAQDKMPAFAASVGFPVQPSPSPTASASSSASPSPTPSGTSFRQTATLIQVVLAADGTLSRLMCVFPNGKQLMISPLGFGKVTIVSPIATPTPTPTPSTTASPAKA